MRSITIPLLATLSVVSLLVFVVVSQPVLATAETFDWGTPHSGVSLIGVSDDEAVEPGRTYRATVDWSSTHFFQSAEAIADKMIEELKQNAKDTGFTVEFIQVDVEFVGWFDAHGTAEIHLKAPITGGIFTIIFLVLILGILALVWLTIHEASLLLQKWVDAWTPDNPDLLIAMAIVAFIVIILIGFYVYIRRRKN